MSNDFDFALLDEMVKEAPTAGFGPNVNFGKCTMEVVIMAWKDRQPQPRPFKKGEVLKEGEYLQITFHVDVAELNPALSNEYKRRVDVKKSGPKSKTDWSETVEPSLKKVFGPDWSKKLGKGAYIEIEDAETVETDKNGNLRGWDKEQDDGTTKHYTNTAPRFVRVFKSKADCEAARAERFAKREEGGGEDGGDGEIPAKVISDVQGLMKALNDDDQVREILASNAPYNAYDTEALLKAANAK